jgi:hypothetical protein
MEKKRTASIYPTVEEINALPEKFRRYIHDLETRCDKSGDVQTIAILREDRDACLGLWPSTETGPSASGREIYCHAGGSPMRRMRER